MIVKATIGYLYSISELFSRSDIFIESGGEEDDTIINDIRSVSDSNVGNSDSPGLSNNGSYNVNSSDVSNKESLRPPYV